MVLLYQTYTFCPNFSIWLVVIANQKAQFVKNILKNQLLRSYMGDVHSISFYKKKNFFIVSNMHFGGYGNLEWP